MNPTDNNQANSILGHLRQGLSITPLQALQLFGCMRLGARIWDLKRAGHNIHREMVSRGGKRFAEYRIA